MNEIKSNLMKNIENQKLWNNIKFDIENIELEKRISALIYQFTIDKICILIFVDTIRKIDNHNTLMKKKNERHWVDIDSPTNEIFN